MNDTIYINDLGILNAQAVGKKEVLHSILSGKQNAFTNQVVHDETYPIFSFPNYDKNELQQLNNNRLLYLISKACNQIEDTVKYFKEKYGIHRIGVLFGSTDNGSEISLSALESLSTTGTFPSSFTLEQQQGHYPAEFIKNHFGLKSYCSSVSSACTSSASAIIKANKLLKSGILDAVIVGGADIVSEAVLKGFISLDAVSKKPTNPFSKNRKGINLGEGAALFVISKDSCNKPGISIIGDAECSDAHHNTAPDPEGKGAISAMYKALEKANKTTVDYINLHGTGTALNDSMEALATHTVFNDHPHCSTTKPMTGHTLGAAGAMELGICWLLLSEFNTNNSLPPQISDGIHDEKLPPLNFVPFSHTDTPINTCMSNNYAFGGCNTSIILSKEGLS
ncbi:MAG: beta-ketoacyl synthase [Fibrobacterales bacterium]